MKIRLLRVEMNHLKHFVNGRIELDFYAEKRVYENEKERHVVSALFSNIYQLNNLALVGINATGKTTTLNLLTDILKVYVDNASLTSCETLANHFDKQLELTVYVTVDDKIYKIHSIIEKNKTENLYFKEEWLYEKKQPAEIVKKALFQFADSTLLIQRSKMDSQFLKRDDSIFSSILNQNVQASQIVYSMNRYTNINLMGYFSEQTPISFVNYLDPAIEEFKYLKEKSKYADPRFVIKFKQEENIIEVDLLNIEKYLSSGTIKGINLLANMVEVLSNGGYLLVDEIENHLNKTLVINLINLFNSKVNVHGATLIFTTHYSEILDSIERSDSIYVFDKMEKMKVQKFSKLADKKDRKDKKNSDLILSGALVNSPSYFAYQELKRDIIRKVEGVRIDD